MVVPYNVLTTSDSDSVEFFLSEAECCVIVDRVSSAAKSTAYGNECPHYGSVASNIAAHGINTYGDFRDRSRERNIV